MADYGDYNGKLTSNENKDELDVKTTTATNAIKRTVVSNYTGTEVKAGPYIGYVLRVDVDVGSGIFFDWFGATYSIKVRVPELDAQIPEPQKFGKDAEAEDVQKIDLHRSYYPMKGGDAPSEPAVGQKVLVDRDASGSGRDWFLEILSKDEGSNVEGQKGSTGGKSSYKGGTKPELNQEQLTPQNPVDQTELDKWNAYSRNSGNPLNIDIVTKTVNGQKITFSRGTMPKYEKFIEIWNTRRQEIINAGLGDVGTLKYKFGEAFRIRGWWFKDGTKAKNPFGWGQFRSGTKAKYDVKQHALWKQTGTHTAGNAVDMTVADFFKKSKSREYTRNYINLLVSCAQASGFKRFGIGRFAELHMDTGVRANGQSATGWWVYDLGSNPTIGYTSERKKAHQKKGYMSVDWARSTGNPPDLTSWDYLGYRYGPDTRGVS
tara:strand:- start:1199 stop:2494 length:1296 start_codon:yes stop_codon:yes gene_type:complete